jgi:hypothetical protein
MIVNASMRPSSQIVPASSKVEVLRSKIEISMTKADTMQWVGMAEGRDQDI